MSTAMTTNGTAALLPATIERVLIQGDLGALKPEERVAYYNKVCESLGLNPLTAPFDYVRFQGKEKLYAKRDATDQLRRIYGVSVVITKRETIDGVLTVTAVARLPDGREDEDIGSLNVQGLRGDALALANMKATTKAKRRVTLSICGLGWLDETELEEAQTSEAPATITVKRTLAEIKASAAIPPTAAAFDAAAKEIAESTPPPSPDPIAKPVKPGPLEPDVPAEEWRLVADELIAKLDGVEHRNHLSNLRKKHAQDAAALKANAPKEYERVQAADKMAAERVK